MAGLSEQVELLGKGLYDDIPDVLTLKSIPTASELDYVGNENFDATMLDTILPAAVEEKGINFRKLLEIDYDWICRCLRILNYGPYHTVNAIICPDCGQPIKGDFQVDLQTVACKPLPEGFKNDIVIPADKFIDYKGDIHLQLMTIQQVMDLNQDKAFKRSDGTPNTSLGRICYSVRSFGTTQGVTPIDVKLEIQKRMTPPDYIILEDEVKSMCDYGLRAAGKTVCPKCGGPNGAFLALADDRFFRPTVGDLRYWAKHRGEWGDKVLQRYQETAVRKYRG